MKKIRDLLFLIILILIIVIVKYCFCLITVQGDSMKNTYNDGDKLFAIKIKNNINRNDVVIAKTNGIIVIKRVIGLPNESLEYKDGIFYINDIASNADIYSVNTENIKINEEKQNCYVLLGDNRKDSIDSRNFGCITEENIIGKVIFKLF